MNQNAEKQPKPEENKPQRKPNELSGIYFSSGIKIFDPNTKEILVQKRGDN